MSRITNKVLQSASAAAQEMEELVVVAFGPEGRAIMVQQPTGQFSITRSGYSILTSIYTEPDPQLPARSVLMNCARKVHESLGDGVKSFIIITSSLLRNCESIDNPAHVARQLQMVQMKLSSFHCQISALPGMSDEALKERIVCFERIIHNFFYTRFPAAVHKVISPLLCQWILSNNSDPKLELYSYNSLQTLQKHFPFLCQFEDGSSRAVAESCVRQGFRVQRPVLNLLRSGLWKIKFIMLGDSDKPESGCFDDIDVEAEANRFISDFEKKGLDLECEGILLVTSALFSDLTVFRLRRLNVAVLQGVLPEEVLFIYSCLSCSQFDGCADSVLNVKSETEYGVDYTWLDIPNVHQLILRAPTSVLTTEYACACQSALRLCMVAASCAVLPNLNPYLTRAGGYFERDLQLNLSLKSGIRPLNPSVCGIRSRAELLAWHKQKQIGSEYNVITRNNKEGTRGEGENIVDSLNNVLKIGDCNDEYNTTKLAQFYSSDSFVNNTESILRCVNSACSGLDESVLGAIIKTLHSIQRRLPLVGEKEECSDMESVGVRLCILEYSLGATASLLRVHDVIQTRKKLPS